MVRHTSYNLNVTRVVHTWIDHELHMQFCCTRVTSCIVSSEPRTRGKIHVLSVHAYIFLYTRTHVYWLYTHNNNLCTELHYSLTKYLHCYNLHFFSPFTFETNLTYPDQFTRQLLIIVPIISAG